MLQCATKPEWKEVERMSKQTVARTHVTRRGYYHNADDYCDLKNLS